MSDAVTLNKIKFVDQLKKFYILTTENDRGMSDMSYWTDGHDEYLIVYFGYGGIKTVCITADSIEAICIDFWRFIGNFDNYEWVSPVEMERCDRERVQI